MSEKLQLSVPRPCHENWNNMTTAEKGRFCNACQKQVIDFTGMSDTQIAAFFKNTNTSVCGRFMNDQLNRDLEIPKKRIPWLKYFFGIALPAFLFSAKAKAQGEAKVMTGDTVIVPLKGKVNAAVKIEQKAAPEKIIKGKVADMDGRPIAGATIVVKGTTLATASDLNGDFKLVYKNEEKNIVLEFSSVGFIAIEKPVQLGEEKDMLIEMMNMPYALAGEVVVVGYAIRKKKKEIPVIPQKLFDTALQKFKVFPNPVHSGTNLNIEIVKEIKEGYYTLDIINQSGQSLYQRELWIDTKTGIVNLTIPAIKPGSYYLSLIHKKSKKRFADKLIIQ